jgi:hypothetical protein
MYPQ